MTKGGAKLRLRRIRETTKKYKGKKPKRIYQCDEGIYHLTSKGEG